jgi:hypothetical protein
VRASADAPGLRRAAGATLLLICAWMTASPALAARPQPALEREIRALTLTEAGRKPAALERDDRLRTIARDHSAAMYEQRLLGHVLADGVGPGQRVAHQHRTLFALIAENVVFQQNGLNGDLADRLVQRWMESPGHRRNILAPYEVLEIGCHGDRTIMFCTQLFASSVARLTTRIPFRHAPGDELTIRLAERPAEGLAGHRDRAGGAHRVSLAPAGETPSDSGVAMERGVARLTLPSSAGLYELHLWTPEADGSLRYEVVGGPFICVTRARDTEPDCGM